VRPARSVREAFEDLAETLQGWRDPFVETAGAETGLDDAGWALERGLDVLRAFLARGDSFPEPCSREGGVAVLLPYNALAALPVALSASAVAAGRRVELRFSSRFPRTSQLMGALIEECLPGARIARGSGRDFLLRHLRRKETRVIVVFGHAEWLLGYEDLMRRAEAPKKLLFHGAAKNPFLVLEDADIAAAARDAVRGALRLAGQTSLAPARFYVVKSVAQEFVQRVLAELCAWRERRGDGFAVVANPRVVERLRAQLEEAIRLGARLHTGGRIEPHPGGPGARIEPAVLTGVSHGMTIMRDETFAPVLPIQEVVDAGEGLAMAEDSRYAFAATVYGGAPEVAERLRKGHGLVSENALPEDVYGFEVGAGGFKSSGWIWERTEAEFCRCEGSYRPWVEAFGGISAKADDS
jgi:succinate-semialdehyde dehydrogenase/glutarate-semialdehyde dehydrogenase